MQLVNKNAPVQSAFVVAGIYSIFGIVWILFSDQVVQQFAESRAHATTLQSAKGVGFIVLSSLLVFGLVYRPLNELTDRNQLLEASLLHSGILHRILRHNLRNSCNIIAGYVDLVDEQTGDECDVALTAIQTQYEVLINLSRKSKYLRNFLDPKPEDILIQDLGSLVQTHVQNAQDQFPQASIDVDVAPQTSVRAHYLIDGAIEELIENAIIHNDSTKPRVSVTIRDETDWVTLTVEDNGPGIPEIERKVILLEEETPTAHSQGLGLWLVCLTVEHSHGRISIEESPSGGSKVEIALPAA